MRSRNFAPGLAVLGMLAAFASEAAQARPRQTQTEAVFVSYDADASTITVKVSKPGKGARPPRNLKLKRGEQAVFKVKDGGSVLTSTVVKTVDGRRGAFADLEPGIKVFVFWVPDEKDENVRFARSISVYVPAQDWGQRAGEKGQAANAAGD